MSSDYNDVSSIRTMFEGLLSTYGLSVIENERLALDAALDQFHGERDRSLNALVAYLDNRGSTPHLVDSLRVFVAPNAPLNALFNQT